jgi:molybdopterin-guanine dinucleotide biosynthesis protein B
MRPPVCVVGPSDSGKTTLVESLVAALDGVSVATIKSIHHDIEIDTPGKDTHRHRTAGADTVVGLTPTLSFEITPGGKRAADSETALLDATVADLRADGYQVILIEGYHNSPYPKLVLGDREDIEPPIVARGSPDSFDVASLATAIVDETLFEGVS